MPSPQLAYALTQIIWKAEHHPEWFEYFNCAIFFDSAYPSCIVMAYASDVNLLSNVLTCLSHRTLRLKGLFMGVSGYS